jgi:hypothetical protein
MYAAHCRECMLRLRRGVRGDGRHPGMNTMRSQAARDRGLIDGAPLLMRNDYIVGSHVVSSDFM